MLVYYEIMDNILCFDMSVETYFSNSLMTSPYELFLLTLCSFTLCVSLSYFFCLNLIDSCKEKQLDWRTQFKIIEGIGRGLLYLHRDCRLRIIHRNLKASNILLYKELNSKILDFGKGGIFGRNEDHANTKRVVGT